MEGWCTLAETWPFVSILAFALVLTFDCAIVEMPKLTPLYPKGWTLKPTWKFWKNLSPTSLIASVDQA
jgi:hypothetical protein